MRIGELAARTGASTRALRYYEQQGLIPARRAGNGYREYDESDVRLVLEIRSLLASGFSLDDARPFVECLRAGHEAGGSCPESVAVYRRKITELDAEIRALIERRAELARQLAGVCPGCVLSPEGRDDHTDDGELRRAGAPRRQAGARRLLDRVVPALQDDRPDPGAA